MKRTIVIGDIHGCHDELIELLEKVNLQADDLIVSLGDIVDRGSKSRETFLFFKDNPQAKVLMGNHERKHIRNIMSYSQEIARLEMAEDYPNFLEWAKGLPYFHETEEAIIVHAFFEEGVSLEKQREEVLSGTTSGSKYLERQYGEGQYWSDKYRGKKPIIYGHHVVGDKVKILNKTYGIDTGACHGGYLTAIVLPSFEIVQVKARKDYWLENRTSWQLPVLKARAWEELTFEKLALEIKKAQKRHPEIAQDYLAAVKNWSNELLALIPLIKKSIYQKKDFILNKKGQKGFNLAASVYPYKVFLFKALNGSLTENVISKQLQSPAQIMAMAKQLALNFPTKPL